MLPNTFGSLASLAVLTGALIAPHAALAETDTPPIARPALDCMLPANKDLPACTAAAGLSDDELYDRATSSAKDGNYQAALDLTAQAHNSEDPRILRLRGLATHKLGDVDAAMPFYQKALALNPDDTKTRQYLGEAYLAQGDMANARVQLRQIEEDCGVSCEDYQGLADAIAATHVKLHTLGLL